jgi:hypothetical protein
MQNDFCCDKPIDAFTSQPMRTQKRGGPIMLPAPITNTFLASTLCSIHELVSCIPVFLREVDMFRKDQISAKFR